MNEAAHSNERVIVDGGLSSETLHEDSSFLPRSCSISGLGCVGKVSLHLLGGFFRRCDISRTLLGLGKAPLC